MLEMLFERPKNSKSFLGITLKNITLNNSEESSYKYIINQSRPKNPGRSVVQPTINTNTVLKCNWLFMFVYDLFDNLSSNILGRDILKFVRISNLRA